MALLSGLLRFCDYLEHRLHTSSLSLLRRILIDFYAGNNEHTLLDFMRLGASVVSVMPMTRTNAHHQVEATRLLTLQTHPTVHNGHDTPSPVDSIWDRSVPTPSEACVFRFLAARVATKNILWLRDMFDEFCKGEDAIVREFVLRGNEPICVIPVDIQALCIAPLPPSPLTVDTRRRRTTNTASTATAPQATRSPALSPHRKRGREIEREQHSRREEMDTTGSARDSHKRKRSCKNVVAAPKESKVDATCEPAPESLAFSSAEEVRQSIVNAMIRIEKNEPWKCTFKPESLVMPFVRGRHPKLAKALQKFWQTHARAVWERKFWSPLPHPRVRQLHSQRRCRQSKARVFFEKRVLIPAYNELGVSFFVDMDRRATPYSGWFYLDQAVDLLTLAQRYGLSACLQYMESEACKRFPVVPGVGRHFFSAVPGKSQSMWSSAPPLRQALNQIIAAKATTMDHTNRS